MRSLHHLWGMRRGSFLSAIPPSTISHSFCSLCSQSQSIVASQIKVLLKSHSAWFLFIYFSFVCFGSVQWFCLWCGLHRVRPPPCVAPTRTGLNQVWPPLVVAPHCVRPHISFGLPWYQSALGVVSTPPGTCMAITWWGLH